ncbi:MAG: amidase [Longimicrobiales bacterium]|nr:amidase [Longimicrobiales bacterium]
MAETIATLRAGRISARELVDSAIQRHEELGPRLRAYKHFDADAARRSAEEADRLLVSGRGGPLCGIPVSVKDVFGVDDMPTFAGTARRLPEDPWSRDAWLVRRIRDAGAIVMGKTHTVELAYGGVGVNPHWGTPLNPWDVDVARIPGGSSCGAGVSLWEGSALLALGSDTGGSIRIPAAFTGVVGHKTTKGRLPTDGVTRLSSTFDTVGALTSSVADSVWFFGCVDPGWGDPEPLVETLEARTLDGVRILVPECGLWDDCSPEIVELLTAALEELQSAGAEVSRRAAPLIDEAYRHYMEGGIGKAEISHWLSRHLPEWREILHPTVGARIEGALPLDGEAYREALSEHRRLTALAGALFDGADVLVLPANLVTPPAVSDVMDDLERYKEVNRETLRPTCPVNMMGLCAVSLPVGLDRSGMPVGLQLVARAGDDEALLGVAWAAERTLGAPVERLGNPPGAPGVVGGSSR